MEISRASSVEVNRGKAIQDQANTNEQLKIVRERWQSKRAAETLSETAAAEPRSANTSSPPTTSGRASKIGQVIVNGIRGEKVIIDLCDTEEQMKSMTVLQLKEKIAQEFPNTASLGDLRLIFTDKALEKDTDLLSAYEIKYKSLIHVVLKVPGGLTA